MRKCDIVGDLMFTQEGAQTYKPVLEISSNRHFTATHPEENNAPIRLLMYSRVV